VRFFEEVQEFLSRTPSLAPAFDGLDATERFLDTLAGSVAGMPRADRRAASPV
jgi:hypothetical protein